MKIVADNRRARFNYFVEETLEAGLMLMGSEVKSLRGGKSNIGDAYAAFEGGELFLLNAYIPEYGGANRFNHEPLRARKLLVHKREMAKLAKAIERGGYTIVPLKLYFNDDGRAKIELGVARGKKLHDKRDTVKERNWDRERARILKRG